jgi:phospholipase C
VTLCGIAGVFAATTTAASAQTKSERVKTAAVTPIQHVIVLYQENHTFDNVFGYWCDQTGRCDGMPSQVTVKGVGTVTPGVTADLVPNLGHGVTQQTAAIDGGAMDGWTAIPGCNKSTSYVCVSGYEPQSIPNLINLAQTFGISDRFFSMADSPSWGGHLYSVAGSLDGFTGDIPLNSYIGATTHLGWGCDSNKDAPWTPTVGGALSYQPSCIPDAALPTSQYPYGGAYRATQVQQVPTILDRLTAANLSWRIYSSGVKTAGGQGVNPAYNQAVCPTFAACRDTSESQNLVPETDLLSDIKSGQLPHFALIVPGMNCASVVGSSTSTGSSSQHNGDSMSCGDNWIGEIVSALEANTSLWDSTSMFITYDDCGCFYDHVAPGVNPDGTPQGPRVPLVIISPYAIAGYVDTTPTTFAGILAYVENVFSLQPVSANDANAYAFANAFNYSQAPIAGPRMVVSGIPTASRNAPPYQDGDDDT